MKVGYLPKNRNTRWPFPTLHTFDGIQTHSSCGMVAKDNPKLILSDDPPQDVIVTVCERCTYGQPRLRSKLYGENRS